MTKASGGGPHRSSNTRGGSKNTENHKQALPAAERSPGSEVDQRRRCPGTGALCGVIRTRLSVLEVGTSLGIATFHFAGQPWRLEGAWRRPSASEDTGETSSIDIARAALAEFADESVKIQLRRGDVSSVSPKRRMNSPKTNRCWRTWAGCAPGMRWTQIFRLSSIPTRAPLPSWTTAGVTRDLSYRQQSQTVWRGRRESTTFGSSVTSVRVWRQVSWDRLSRWESAEVQRCLTELAHLFSERLDPLWLAGREQGIDRHRKHLQGRGGRTERATSGLDRRKSIAGRPQHRTPETHLPARKAKIPVGRAQRRPQNREQGPQNRE